MVDFYNRNYLETKEEIMNDYIELLENKLKIKSKEIIADVAIANALYDEIQNLKAQKNK